MRLKCIRNYTLKFKEGNDVKYIKGKTYRVETMSCIPSLFSMTEGENYNWIHPHQFCEVDIIFGEGSLDSITSDH